MLLLTICIVVNTFIGVIFKYFAKYKINTLAAIVVNYYVCVLTSMAVTGSFTINANTLDQAYLPYAAGLGILFISVFDIVARTVGKFGIVVASVFQKMSLILPTVIAIGFFGEHLGIQKAIGIGLAITSILLITNIVARGSRGNTDWKDWILPILTLAGSSLVDLGLYLVQANNIADNGDITFVATLFGTAALAGTVLLLYKLNNGSVQMDGRDVIAGICLGIPNFFSIYLLLLLLADGWDGSAIFPINNVGILSLSALVGFVLFREKITRNRAIGVVLSILAIFMIANG